MGDQSTPETMAACATAAEDAGLESVWIVDHIAIPPEAAEGSNGRYLDPLTTLAWLAGMTTRIRLGVGVLIIPYRPAPAHGEADCQHPGVVRRATTARRGHWLDGSGVPRTRRRPPQTSRLADETLAFIRDCFDNDVVSANGQTFLFRPRPAPPPIYIGGAAPHALRRAAKYGDGWLPMGMTPDKLSEARADYAEFCEAVGRPVGEIVVMGACRWTTSAGHPRRLPRSATTAPHDSSSADATRTATNTGKGSTLLVASKEGADL